MDVTIEKSGAKGLAHLAGRFDIGSSLAFRNAIKSLLHDGEVETMTVDFREVSFMDSSALGMLLLLREQAQQAHKDVVLSSCNADLQRVLSLAQFHRIFRIE